MQVCLVAVFDALDEGVDLLLGLVGALVVDVLLYDEEGFLLLGRGFFKRVLLLLLGLFVVF